MTDNEIIKALECCVDGECGECCFDEQTACKEYLLHAALDLIERQQAELEAAKAEKNALIKTYAECQLDNLKAFVKYLKKHACSYDLDNYHWFQAVDVEYLEDFIQEFVEAKYDR